MYTKNNNKKLPTVYERKIPTFVGLRKGTKYSLKEMSDPYER